MKIAVAISEKEKISKHFGRSPIFNIYHIVDGSIIGLEQRSNTFTHHFKNEKTNGKLNHHNHDDANRHNHNHKGIIEGLYDCQTVICGGIGQGAHNALLKGGKHVIITDLDNAEDAAQGYILGKLDNNLQRLN